MNIDRSSFLMIMSTLAIGGAAGYVAAEKRMLPAVDKWIGRPPEYPAPEPPRPEARPVADAAPAMTTPPPPPPPAPAAPACDDSAGTVGECPPPGFPTIEGGCGSFAHVRCKEMKEGMKPKVAATAVACLNKLTPQERCDPARVSLCGHLAFMNACPERDDGIAEAGAALRPVNATCQAIIEGCATSPIVPSMVECKQLLAGMTDSGRERTRGCMKTHCFDRGLVGCEAVVTAK